MSENTNQMHPDARHLISVARNLLWQAHEGFMDEDARQPGLPPAASSYAISTTIKAAIAIIDGMRSYIVQHEPVPCKNTTMPPGTDNAWQHFLAHVQACYLPFTLTDAEREAAERAKDWVSAMWKWQSPYYYKDYSYQRDAAALRGLLERTK